MSHRRVLLAAALDVGVVVPVVSAVPGAIAAPGTAPAGPTVTLLTGDEVTLGSTPACSTSPSWSSRDTRLGSGYR